MSETIPEGKHIALRQGDTWKISVVVYRVDVDYKFITDSAKRKIPKSIVGATAQWQLARSVGEAPLLTKSSPTDIVLSDPENGLLVITVPKTETADLIGTYWQEVQIEDGLGNRSTVFQGQLTVQNQLIRP